MGLKRLENLILCHRYGQQDEVAMHLNRKCARKWGWDSL